MSQQFCSNCGSQIPLDSKFCTSCGHQVNAQTEQPIQTDQASTNTTGDPLKKPNNNKWILIGAAAVVAILAFFMFNKEDGPEKVAEDFVKYMSNLELEKVKGLLAWNVDEDLQDEIDWMLEEIKDDPSLLDIQKESEYQVKSFKITDVDEEEDYAFVYGEITYRSGETESIDIDLLKENGKWKVEDSY